MQTKVKQFYDSPDDFRQFYFKLKQTACPHCKTMQYLILHGYLYGYSDVDSHKRVIRGHRIFCSNRNRRQGCGGTFSVLASHILKHCTMTADSFWLFLKNISLEWSKLRSFRSLNLPFSNSTIYRLWKRFDHSQSRIRSVLSRMSSPPKLTRAQKPFLQTIHHLMFHFGGQHCPIAAFQQHYQTAFLF